MRDVKPQAEALKEQMQAWADEHAEEVGNARPEMPDQISDRMQEGCESLIAIADIEGVGKAARGALVKLLTGERFDRQDVMRKRLLRDLKRVWEALEQEHDRRIPAARTQTLLLGLQQIEDAIWAERYYGHSLEATDLASLLAHYELRPTRIKFEGKVWKGYRRDPLWNVFERYLR